VIHLLDIAIGQLETVDCNLYAAAARRRKGEILGSPEGQDLIAEADQWMKENGIINPEKMTNLLAPGFG